MILNGENRNSRINTKVDRYATTNAALVSLLSTSLLYLILYNATILKNATHDNDTNIVTANTIFIIIFF